MDITTIQNIGNQPRILGFRRSALIEIAVFFLLAGLGSYFFGFNYNKLAPHPFFIIIILMAVQYGTKKGILAAIFSTLFFFLGKLPQETILEDRFAYIFVLIKLPLFWFVTAVILGELRMRHIRERDSLKEVALETLDKERVIAEAYNDMKKIKEGLELRVVSEMKTALMAYDAFKKLADQGQMLEGAMALVRTLLMPEKFSIYLLEGQILQKKAAEGWDSEDSYTSSFGADTLLFQEIMAKRHILSLLNSDDFRILGKEGVLALPIMHEDHVYGMMKVEMMPFSHLRTTTIETLNAIGEWLGSAFASRPS